jgi:hypothetical protein
MIYPESRERETLKCAPWGEGGGSKSEIKIKIKIKCKIKIKIKIKIKSKSGSKSGSEQALHNHALNAGAHGAEGLLFLWSFAPADSGMGHRRHAGLHCNEHSVQMFLSLVAA